jgi:hypothetical protein
MHRKDVINRIKENLDKADNITLECVYWDLLSKEIEYDSKSNTFRELRMSQKVYENPYEEPNSILEDVEDIPY